jgi:hypothetical protein
MIRHVVLFRWKPEATQEQKARAASEIAKLPSIVPSVRGFECGADIRVNEGNFDFSVTADFDDEAGYIAYRDDPAHRQMVADFIVPAAADRAAIQFQY